MEEKEETQRNTPAYFKNIKITNGFEEKNTFSYGDDFVAFLEIFSEDKNIPLKLGFVLFRNDGIEVLTSTSFDKKPLKGKNNYFCKFTIPSIPLIKGEYRLVFYLTDEEGLHLYHIYEIPSGLILIPPLWYNFFGIINPETKWDLDIEINA